MDTTKDTYKTLYNELEFTAPAFIEAVPMSKGLIEKLLTILKAGEDGRLLALPCKVYDTVYYIDYGAKNAIVEGIVWAFDIGLDETISAIVATSDKKIQNLGKYVKTIAIDKLYLTQAEAETILKDKKSKKIS